jgi:heptaprenylglyceryl phosphate synthase
MSPTAGLVTVLLRLPLFYKPDASGQREPVENEKFMRTAEEIAQRFGGGIVREAIGQYIAKRPGKKASRRVAASRR